MRAASVGTSFESAQGEVDATFDASVKTLETQLLLLLRSKLEAAAQQEIDGKRQLLAEARARRDVMMRDQQEHVSDLEALKQRLEDQLAALESDSLKHGTQGEEIDFALLVDGLAAAIKAFGGGVVLVSHDERLISLVVDEIWQVKKDRKSVV